MVPESHIATYQGMINNVCNNPQSMSADNNRLNPEDEKMEADRELTLYPSIDKPWNQFIVEAELYESI